MNNKEKKTHSMKARGMISDVVVHVVLALLAIASWASAWAPSSSTIILTPLALPSAPAWTCPARPA